MMDNKMLDAQETVDGKVAAIDRKHPVLSAAADTAANWALIQQHWQTLRDSILELAGPDSFARHSALIGQVLELKSRYADVCGMTLDPQSSSYSLLDALIAKVPATLEHVAQARGMGTGIAARGSMTFEERMRMVALSTLIRHSIAGLRQALAAANARSNQLQEIDDFLRLVDGSLVDSSEVRLNPDSYFAQGTNAIEAGRRLYGDIEQTLVEQFQRRADGYRLQLRLAGVCAAAALSSAYLHPWA